MQKTGAENPTYGTIQMRQAAGIFDYIDPNGRKPTPYAKIMKKYKLTEEQVLAEAGKFHITIDPQHFIAPQETKRGRPKSQKQPKEKGTKGRPKKSKKVLELEGEEEEEGFFEALVKEANLSEEGTDTPPLITTPPLINTHKSVEKKTVEKTVEKAEKEALKAQKAAEKAQKEAEKAAEKAQKEAEKAQKEAQKAAEKAQKEAEKALKKKSLKVVAKEVEKPKDDDVFVEEGEVEEPKQEDKVKKFQYNGKMYLKSKISGIVYDYAEYVENGEQVIVGKWNDNEKVIDFNKDDDSSEDSEEEEEDYDSEYEVQSCRPKV